MNLAYMFYRMCIERGSYTAHVFQSMRTTLSTSYLKNRKSSNHEVMIKTMRKDTGIQSNSKCTESRLGTSSPKVLLQSLGFPSLFLL